MLALIKKLVTSACYDKQHVCAYLQLFSRYMSKWRKRITFRGYPSFTLACAGLLKPGRSNLRMLKCLMLKMSHAGCRGLPPATSVQFTFKMRVAARNREEITKPPYFGNSRSFKVIDVDSPKTFVTSACYDKQHVYTYMQPFSLYTIRANSGKITTF